MRTIAAIIAAALVSLVFAGCTLFEPADCRKADLAAYADQMQDQIVAFRQQSDLVAATPRVGLGAPIQRLLDIQTETRAVEAPGCVVDYHSAVVTTMQLIQQQYQAFAAQQGDATTTALLLAQLGTVLTKLEGDLEGIRAGSPPPTATPEPPTPTAGVLSEPEAGAVQVIAFLSPEAGGGEGNVGALCPVDRFDVLETQQVEGELWARVRVTAIGEAPAGDPCAAAASAIGRAEPGVEGWLEDSKIFAP